MQPSILRVVHPGAFATIQDLGRPGARAFGVPTSGAFDQSSFRLANAMVGNSPHAAALELTLFGGEYEAECPLAVALAGAPMPATLDSPSGSRRSIDLPRAFSLHPGERLRLGGARQGVRTYLAVGGGFQTIEILKSRSWETPLSVGSCLPVRAGSCPTRWPSSFHDQPNSLQDRQAPIRVLAGPDANILSDDWMQNATFRVGALSDRAGVRLDGTVPHPTAEFALNRRSAPVAPGAVQWTPEGLILLGPASGTMGGYPHVAHVISADLDRLGQLRSGDEVRFLHIDLTEARRLDRDRARFLQARDARIALLP